MAFPTVGQVTPQVAPQVTPQVKELLKAFSGEHTRQELQDKMNLDDRKNFRIIRILPALSDAFIELTIPDKPNSSKQKYRLTEKGVMAKK